SCRRRLPAPLRKIILDKNPELSDDERNARQHHEPREIAPRDIVVLRPIDRKIPPPSGLLALRLAVGRSRELVRILLRFHDCSSVKRPMPRISSVTCCPVPVLSIAAVTSTLSTGASFGTIIFTFVVIVCLPNRNSFTGLDNGRRASISSRVPKNNAWLGQ